MLYLLAALLAHLAQHGYINRPPEDSCIESIFPRPVAITWGCFLAYPYGFSSIGLYLLRVTNSDFGYCILDLTVFWYSALYAFAVLSCFVEDTEAERRRLTITPTTL